MSKTTEHQEEAETAPSRTNQHVETEETIHQPPTQPSSALRGTRESPPGVARSADILSLQATVGNRAVQRLIPPATVQRHGAAGRERLERQLGYIRREIGANLALIVQHQVRDHPELRERATTYPWERRSRTESAESGEE